MKKIFIHKTVNILGIAGSLQHTSYNRTILRAAQMLVPDDAELEIFELDDIPIFNRDEEQRPPAKVVELKTRVRAADAILFVTLEYNNSIPSVLKNAISWASRPYEDNVWNGKPVALMGATVGMPGKAHAQNLLRQIVDFLNMYPLEQPDVIIAYAAEKFDTAGNLTDYKTKVLIRKLLKNLVGFSKQLQETKQERMISLAGSQMLINSLYLDESGRAIVADTPTDEQAARISSTP